MSTLAELSRRYSDRSTMLTEGLLRFESMLLDLPGRVRVATKIGDGQYIAWDRHEKDWRLLYGVGDSEGPLVSCSVEVKAYAAKYLACLHEDIELTLINKIGTVDTGLGALHEYFTSLTTPTPAE